MSGKTRALALLVVLSNVLGNSLLSAGMQGAVPATPVGYLAALFHPVVAAGALALTLSMGSQAALLSWADLSFVMPLTAAGYVLTAVAGNLFLGDAIPPLHWAGIVLITGGVALVSQTAPAGPEW